MTKPKVMWADYCGSYIVIYFSRDVGRNVIEKGFQTPEDANAFAAQMEEENAHPILWCNK